MKDKTIAKPSGGDTMKAIAMPATLFGQPAYAINIKGSGLYIQRSGPFSDSDSSLNHYEEIICELARKVLELEKPNACADSEPINQKEKR